MKHCILLLFAAAACLIADVSSAAEPEVADLMLKNGRIYTQDSRQPWVRALAAKGGKIIVTGENIEVAGAKINASGRDGGGTVMIGGDWGGGNPNTALVSNQSAQLESYKISNATTVSVDGATKIDASAKDRGDDLRYSREALRQLRRRS